MSLSAATKEYLLSDLYSEAIRRAMRRLIAQQNDDGSYGKPEGSFLDLAGYYKSCWVFARASELNAGERLIGFLEERFLTNTGDLVPSPDLIRPRQYG